MPDLKKKMVTLLTSYRRKKSRIYESRCTVLSCRLRQAIQLEQREAVSQTSSSCKLARTRTSTTTLAIPIRLFSSIGRQKYSHHHFIRSRGCRAYFIHTLIVNKTHKIYVNSIHLFSIREQWTNLRGDWENCVGLLHCNSWIVFFLNKANKWNSSS